MSTAALEKVSRAAEKAEGIARWLRGHSRTLAAFALPEDAEYRYFPEGDETGMTTGYYVDGMKADHADFYVNGREITINVYGPNVARTMTNLRRAIGGTKWDKRYYSHAFCLVKEYPEGFRVSIDAPREAVCTRKVTGTRTVDKPDLSAAPIVQVTEEIVEWECDPILTGDETVTTDTTETETAA